MQAIDADGEAQLAFRRIENFISRSYRYGDVDRDSKARVIISYRPLFPCFMTPIQSTGRAKIRWQLISMNQARIDGISK